MKKSFILLQASIVILMLTFSLKASAQAPFTGPSNAVPYNASTTPADGFVCLGGTIKLTGQGATGNVYRWYKKSPTTGNPVLVAGPGAIDANTYTEVSTASGYYTYYVDQINPNGCISPMSSAINIYVLPSITPVISGGNNYCANLLPTNLTLSISPALDINYNYTYQWTEDGQNISGATNSTYVVTNITPATHTYTVKVTYVLSAGLTPPCTYESGVKSITVYPVPTKPTIQVN